jgi:hypothetical protein
LVAFACGKAYSSRDDDEAETTERWRGKATGPRFLLEITTNFSRAGKIAEPPI